MAPYNIQVDCYHGIQHITQWTSMLSDIIYYSRYYPNIMLRVSLSYMNINHYNTIEYDKYLYEFIKQYIRFGIINNNMQLSLFYSFLSFSFFFVSHPLSPFVCPSIYVSRPTCSPVSPYSPFEPSGPKRP